MLSVCVYSTTHTTSVVKLSSFFVDVPDLKAQGVKFRAIYWQPTAEMDYIIQMYVFIRITAY